MERDRPGYIELLEISKVRKAQYIKDCEKFDQECNQEIEQLQAKFSRKLDAFDEDSKYGKDAAEKAEEAAIAKLKQEHEEQLRFVIQRHKTELADLEKENKKKRREAARGARDQKVVLATANEETIARRREEHVKLRAERQAARKVEEAEEFAEVCKAFEFDRDGGIQETLAGSPPPSTTKEHDPLPIRNSPASSPAYSPAQSPMYDPAQSFQMEVEIESGDDEDVELIEPPPPIRLGKRKKTAEILEDYQILPAQMAKPRNFAEVQNEDSPAKNVTAMMIDEQGEQEGEEARTDPASHGDESSAAWSFAMRYKKTISTIATPAPTAPVPEQDSSRNSLLPARDSDRLLERPRSDRYMPDRYVPDRYVPDRYMPDMSSTPRDHDRGLDQERDQRDGDHDYDERGPDYDRRDRDYDRQIYNYGRYEEFDDYDQDYDRGYSNDFSRYRGQFDRTWSRNSYRELRQEHPRPIIQPKAKNVANMSSPFSKMPPSGPRGAPDVPINAPRGPRPKAPCAESVGRRGSEKTETEPSRPRSLLDRVGARDEEDRRPKKRPKGNRTGANEVPLRGGRGELPAISPEPGPQRSMHNDGSPKGQRPDREKQRRDAKGRKSEASGLRRREARQNKFQNTSMAASHSPSGVIPVEPRDPSSAAQVKSKPLISAADYYTPSPQHSSLPPRPPVSLSKKQDDVAVAGPSRAPQPPLASSTPRPAPPSRLTAGKEAGTQESIKIFGPGGNLPICPSHSISSALERMFVDSNSDEEYPNKRAANTQPSASVDPTSRSQPASSTQRSSGTQPASTTQSTSSIDAYAIKKIHYTRDDNTTFEWTRSVPGKAELRLDHFIYKPFFLNEVWEVSQDWHYTNWAIVPDHVECLRYSQELAILYVKRRKTAQASEELWVMFESGEVLEGFLADFKSRPGCGEKDIRGFEDDARIPEEMVMD